MGRKEEKIIGFRVTRYQFARLEDAAHRAGMSPHKWARLAALRELDGDNPLPRMVLQVEAIAQELIELRKDMAVATEGLLVSAGKASNEQAARFVRANMKVS